jgi:DNA-directed RNA polymerase subunit RPC12/RpoP
MLDQSRTPNVSPEVLRRPPSAMIGGGVVSCVGCGKVIALVSADIVGLGYRCPGCSSRMSVKSIGRGTGSQATVRARQAAARSGMELIWIGMAVLALGAVLMAMLFWRTGVAAMLLGGATIGVGVARRKSAY